MCDATHNLSESLRRTVRDAIQLSPTTPDSLGCCRKGAAHMGKEDKRLWRDSLLFQPAKTGAEVGSTASLRSELYGLIRLAGSILSAADTATLPVSCRISLRRAMQPAREHFAVIEQVLKPGAQQ